MMNGVTRLIAVTILLFAALFVTGISESNANTATDTATIEIPAIGISAPIVTAPLTDTNWEVSHLNWTVGHLSGLPWFGSDNNVSLAGHATDAEGNPNIFYDLHLLQPGSEITVHANGQSYRYIVSENYSVSANNMRPLYPIYGSRLTLVTCDVNSFNSATNTYGRRIIVVALPA